MSIHTLYNEDCLDVLRQQPTQSIATVFMDPPDNIGLGYDEHRDNLPPQAYYAWLEAVILEAVRIAQTVWISYYHAHDIELKYRLRDILKNRNPAWRAKSFIWRFTFGQHNVHDCGSGFRPIIRLTSPLAGIQASAIRVESERQRLGDKRANPEGRVPDDVWDFPRVVGNAHERRAWHPTQHPEALIDRIIRFSTKEDETIFDCFAGTGTVARVAHYLKRNSISCETSANYCQHLLKENEWLKPPNFAPATS